MTYTTTTSFSPTLTFGGGSTGITYTTQVGDYYRIGELVWIVIYIVLSSKGSSTGDAAFSNLPFAIDTTYPYTFSLAGLGGTITYTGDVIGLSASSTTIVFSNLATGTTATNLTDAAFTNTTDIKISGFYITSA